MKYLVLSLVIYIITGVFHILLYRFLVKIEKTSFKSIIVFILGFIVNTYFIYTLSTSDIEKSKSVLWNIPLPLSSIVIFGLLSFCQIIFFTSPYFDDMSPSMKIYLLLRKYKRARYEKIKRYFSDREVVISRLDSLDKAKLVNKKNNTYFITPLGRKLIAKLNAYRNLIGWKSSG